MPHRARKIVQARLLTPTSGVVELARDWPGLEHGEFPEFYLSGSVAFERLERVPDAAFGKEHGFFIGPGPLLYFTLSVAQHPEIDPLADRLYIAGDFNGWQAAVGKASWELHPATVSGEIMMVWVGPAEAFLRNGPQRFKFVTGEHRWLEVPPQAPNAHRDDQGNLNHLLEPERTGRHLFRFQLGSPLDLSKPWRLEWPKGVGEGVSLRPDGYFFDLKSDLQLGAIVRQDETIFRLFAPRASKVELCLTSTLDPATSPLRYPLVRRAEPVERLREAFFTKGLGETRAHRVGGTTPSNWQGVWEVTLDQNLHGWYYSYHIDGPSNSFGSFDRHQKVLDPYALACIGPEGPGIIIDRNTLAKPDKQFKTPVWQDLVIAEAHVRDLVGLAPVHLTAEERLGFTGLRKWVESPDFYLHKLGINCVELQPIHENDAKTREEYAWGYMPVSWFAPASTFSSTPATASGIREFQELVAAFHKRGMAVVIDVVFNHQGVPAHLMSVDKHYFFEADARGNLSNWSGCGNDFRARSAMARRLIIDSCVHLLETYGVDGFRFDLAELLGLEVLRDIERALKLVRRDVILIAEPWSFRGHLAGQLSETGWSSWNDGYRNFVRDYLRGGSGADHAEYFLKGSPWYFARWPAQTVNYTESHDDRTWIDSISDNSSGNGYHPSALDRRRTHLMAALLFSSLGIPMLSAGQDFLRSKHGVNNTYLRGDLNALDYRRIHRFPGTHSYFAAWIAFRLSEQGRLLRQWSCPSEGFFRRFSTSHSSALALLYNADGSQGLDRLLFAINPGPNEVELPIDIGVAGRIWNQLADHERFDAEGLSGYNLHVTENLYLPAFSCGLWLSKA